MMLSCKCVSVAEEMNPSFRRTMEDAHVTVDNFAGIEGQGYFAVYDGHGGRAIVEFVEKYLHINLEAEVKEAVESKRSFAECMKAAFLLTDIQTHKANLHVSGSTAACCVLTPRNRETGRRQLHTANCGDARVVLARGGKTAMRLTHDHKATTIEEKKRIEADGGFVLRGVLGILAVSGVLETTR